MPRKSIKNMTEQELLAQIETNEAKREELFKQIKPLEKEVSSLYKKNETLRNQIVQIKSEQMKKRNDWEWILHKDHYDTVDRLRFRDEKLREIGLTSDGFFPETEQCQIQVRLIKNDPDSLKTTLAGLKKILKYIKPMKDGIKQIDIMEASLSRNGIFYIVINEEENIYEIKKCVYHRVKTLDKFDNLKDLLAKVQNKYYYEDKLRSEDEEDEEYDW
jgi:hypothetical protein